MADVELYGTAGCPYTRDAREDLQWSGTEFVEYDVELDREALARMKRLSGGRTVPVVVKDGRVVRVGWQGRGCIVGED